MYIVHIYIYDIVNVMLHIYIEDLTIAFPFTYNKNKFQLMLRVSVTPHTHKCIGSIFVCTRIYTLTNKPRISLIILHS